MKRIGAVLALGLVMVGTLYAADEKLHTRERYRLHTGDSLLLEYRLSPELNQTAMIAPDGYVDLNVAGSVKIAGLTLQEAHDLIVQRASERLNQPELKLELKDFQRPYVMVAGQVQSPGKIEMREDMTALQAVMLAGGFRDTAKESKIVVFRRISQGSDMAEVRQLNLHKIHKTIQLEKDMALEPGDILYVPNNALAKFSQIMRVPNFSSGAQVPIY
jgi:polysaccharide export outer membrane protein